MVTFPCWGGFRNHQVGIWEGELIPIASLACSVLQTRNHGSLLKERGRCFKDSEYEFKSR